MMSPLYPKPDPASPLPRGPLGRAGARRLATALLCVLASAGTAAAATVQVRVDNVAPGEGRVLVSLCINGLDPADCKLGQSAQASGPAMVFTFPAVPPGTYAVAAFQDLNGDGTLNRSRNGLPLEPYAFSNGAGRTGAPRFDRAAVMVEGDLALTLRLAAIAGRR